MGTMYEAAKNVTKHIESRCCFDLTPHALSPHGRCVFCVLMCVSVCVCVCIRKRE